MMEFIKNCLLILFTASVCQANQSQNPLLQWKFLPVERNPTEPGELAVRFQTGFKEIDLRAFNERQPTVEELLREAIDRAAKGQNRWGPQAYGRLTDNTLTLHPPIALSPVEVAANSNESRAKSRLSYVSMQAESTKEKSDEAGLLILYPGLFPLDEWHMQKHFEELNPEIKLNKAFRGKAKRKLSLHGSLTFRLHALEQAAQNLRTKIRPGWRQPSEHEPVYHLRGKIDGEKKFGVERAAVEVGTRLTIGVRPGLWKNTEDLVLVRGTLMKEDSRLYVLSPSRVKHAIDIIREPSSSESADTFKEHVCKQLHLKEVVVQGLEGPTVAFGHPVIYIFPDHNDVSFIEAAPEESACAVF